MRVIRIENEFLWLALLGLGLLALIGVNAQGLPSPFALVRLALAALFILFVPGYALQAALFPHASSLNGWERVGLSYGLSLALLPVLALILDRLPWGVQLVPMLVGLTLLCGICAVVALVRRRRMPEDRFLLTLAGGQNGGTPFRVPLSAVLFGVAMLLAGFAAVSIVVLPKPAEQLTEFYLVPDIAGEQGVVPARVVGETVSATLGIVNRERVERTYRIQVWGADAQDPTRRALIAERGPFALAANQTRQEPVTWEMPTSGSAQDVQVLLLVDGQSDVYRELRFRLEGTP